MKNIVFVVGEPGVGKSTLVAKAWEDCERHVVDHKAEGGPMRELIFTKLGVVVELGHRAGKHPDGYPGTDAMSMTAITGVDEWLRAGGDEVPAMVLEGTRLANKRFLLAAQAGGWTVTVVRLHGPVAAHARRVSRGSRQDARWLTGRQTAAENFAKLAARMGCDVVTLEADADLTANARYVRQIAGLSARVA